ncbi:tyrosine-type recombinase/integrase [Arthrobacter sp. EH-1B-1]|uniref:Tyrosine-type recombinase/integrase n=1 Tax=Arthrobacter vasquezii TaxID=2977629 RepID=A0ABT6CZ12_9MICC|nr:tyrosine-type recombinase/integrase [Arthrobacter vasquezii]MDF9279277.1 tyrosine-type recombinase/integrase [Arthrobacter vasquezii]
MRVSKVLDPASNAVSFTLIGETGVVGPAERYLRYLAETERSPNTIKAHAHDLKDWFVFLNGYGLDWQSVKLEDVGAFIRWLRRPPDVRGEVLSVLPTIGHHCGEATVNRKLSTVSIFYQHAARHGLDLGELITCWDPSARQRGWKPFLHHISKGTAKQRKMVKLPSTTKIPRLLTPVEVQSILDSCGRLRDRLLFALLHDSGIRIGEALGLRHEDIAVAEREITVCRRDNTNGARAKSPHSRTIPVTAELIRLYADYLDVEYGDLDSDYVFVNLWGRPYGKAMTYAAVHDLVQRLRRSTGIAFDPHWLRHTYATRLLRENVPVEVVSKLLGHASLTTTIKTYAHVSSDDARRALADAGWFNSRTVTI